MNFAALKVRAALLSQFGGWSNVDPAPDYGALVNAGLRQVCRDLRHYQESATFASVINQAEYTLATPTFIEIMEVWRSTTTRLDFWTQVDLETQDYGWLMRTAGTPSYYLLPRPNRIRLYPKPSAVATYTVYGLREEPTLSADGDECYVPLHEQEAIAIYASIQVGKLYTTGEENYRLKMYQAEYEQYISQYKALYADQRAPFGVSYPSTVRV